MKFLHLPALLLPLMITTLTHISLANAESVSSAFQVEVPLSLKRDEGYQHREALFGIPPYGGYIAQKVYYADSNFCDTVDDPIDLHKGYPCTPDSNGKCEAWIAPFILMVDRGGPPGCTFVTKIRNAQNLAGASGVLIADQRCMCSDVNADTCTNNPGEACQSVEPIMADDGSGSNVDIPSFLLFKQDSENIKKELKNNQTVMVKMSWAMPAPDDRVEYTFWSTPVEGVSKDFQSKFYEPARALGKDAFFTPHYNIYDGKEQWKCYNNPACGSLCTNNGRYCAVDPDNNQELGVSGADVVVESLRRLCIWSHYGDDGIGQEWWMYTKSFLEDCDDEQNFPSSSSTSTCHEKSMKKAHIDKSVIEHCMSDSGGTASDRQNTLLDGEITAAGLMGVNIIPSLYVNEVVMRGAITQQSVFNTICAGYLDGSSPQICNVCKGNADVQGCVQNGGTSSGGGGGGGDISGGVSTTTLVVSLLFTVSVFAAGGFAYYRQTQREMREQVRGILSEYMPLDDGVGTVAPAGMGIAAGNSGGKGGRGGGGSNGMGGELAELETEI